MKSKKVFAALMSAVLALGGMANAFPSLRHTADSPAYTVEAAAEMHRPCNADNPMWIVHIETWNHADPQRIIELIPEDVRPYVVFNISMSIYWDHDNHRWGMVQDGYELAKSWLKTCADEGVWCMVQPSSGGQCHFPDYPADYDLENTLFGEFFRDYPNFIGFNYCEQFWGFEQEDFPITCPDRYRHFAALLKLCDRYGDYLNVSWCGNQWSPNINPLAMLKQVPEWEAACRTYSDHFILEEKYTQASYISDVESLVYGYYIAGYCGNFGIRYDETGWTDSTWSGTGESSKEEFNQATGLPIYLERMVKNGATVIDGPELVTVDDFKETWGYTDSEGYHVRDWAMYDQFQNVPLDFIRKIIDGTVRIPTREEVIANTDFVIVQDVASGSIDDQYSTYPSLFEGLYRMPNDGNLRDNHNLYKSTGRYQTIPTVYALNDALAQSIPVQIKQSQIATQWSSISAKQAAFNERYPSEYYGNCYAGRNENTWIAYNNNKNGSNCGAVLSLQYNTCESIDVNFNAYGNAIIQEYSDRIDIYANNFNEDAQTTLVTDTFKIAGCAAEPTIIYKDRGVNQTPSQVTTSYANGTYTVTVKHNGPIDLSIACSGTASNRLSAPAKQPLTPPAAPPFYTGVRQYEGEFFHTKNVEGNVANACGSGVSNIQGQGFLKYGKNANAAVKDIVTTRKAGNFTWSLRYSIPSASQNVDLYVNGSKVETLVLQSASSYSTWNTVTVPITLQQGDNRIELQSNSALPASLYIDQFTVSGDFGETAEPTVLSGSLIGSLTVLDSENSTDWSIQTGFAEGSLLYGDRALTAVSVPACLVGGEAIRPACDAKLLTTDLAKLTAAADITLYAAVDTRVEAFLPTWLQSWTKTEQTMMTSNDVALRLYQIHVTAGETITLGTNSGNGNAVNYVVVAVLRETGLKGDVDCNGVVAVSDAVLLSRYLSEDSAIAVSVQGLKNAECDDQTGITISDMQRLLSYLSGRSVF